MEGAMLYCWECFDSRLWLWVSQVLELIDARRLRRVKTDERLCKWCYMRHATIEVGEP